MGDAAWAEQALGLGQGGPYPEAQKPWSCSKQVQLREHRACRGGGAGGAGEPSGRGWARPCTHGVGGRGGGKGLLMSGTEVAALIRL